MLSRKSKAKKSPSRIVSQECIRELERAKVAQRRTRERLRPISEIFISSLSIIRKPTNDKDTSDVEDQQPPEGSPNSLGNSLARVLGLSDYREGEKVSENNEAKNNGYRDQMTHKLHRRAHSPCTRIRQ